MQSGIGLNRSSGQRSSRYRLRLTVESIAVSCARGLEVRYIYVFKNGGVRLQSACDSGGNGPAQVWQHDSTCLKMGL